MGIDIRVKPLAEFPALHVCEAKYICVTLIKSDLHIKISHIDFNQFVISLKGVDIFNKRNPLP